jgi:two-component system, NarL family, sensor histidine kinase DegS
MTARATGGDTAGPLTADADLRAVFDLVDDPLLVLDVAGLVTEANAAARRVVDGLQVGAPLPVAASNRGALLALLRLCDGTEEPLPGSVVLSGQGGPTRYHCRGRQMPGNPARTLLHLHVTGIDRRFSILAERLVDARRVMDERRRRERDLRLLLMEREELLARREADGEARAKAERQRDEVLSRLYLVGQDERQALARDLHDHAGQQVVALNLGLSKLARHLATSEALAEHEALLAQVQGIMDSLKRVVLELRPPALDEFGFVTALRGLVQEWSDRSGTSIEFKVAGEERPLAGEVAITLYRIAQEALTNVAKHGGPVDTVAVILRFDHGRATLTVDDDGAGFDAGWPALRHLFKQGRLGLAGMRERLALVGGTLRIVSAPGRGTTVVAGVPTVQEVE